MDLTNIHDDWKKDAPNLAALKVINPFGVPDDYFTRLTKHLQSRLNVETALDKHSFSVPAKYFEQLQERTLAVVQLSQLKNGALSNEFKVPENYFSELSDTITARIAIEEAIEPDAFSVPEGYFDKLQDTILAQTVLVDMQKPATKVLKLVPVWMKYAAAACITTLIGTGVFFKSTIDKTSSFEQQLAEIPEHEIVNYLQAYSSPGDNEVITEQLEKMNDLPTVKTKLSEQEIKEYLELTL